MELRLRIEEDLLVELKARAAQEGLPLARLVNRLLRAGLAASSSGRRPEHGLCRESTYAMGTPRVNLDKALAIVAADQDREMLQK